MTPDERTARYLAADGLKCPICDSANIRSISNFRNEDITVIEQKIECRTCTSTWKDLYTLSGLTLLTEGSPAEVQTGLFDGLADD